MTSLVVLHRFGTFFLVIDEQCYSSIVLFKDQLYRSWEIKLARRSGDHHFLYCHCVYTGLQLIILIID